METQELQLSHTHQAFIQRFVAACRADERVVAAFLGGSYARETADAYSDLDLSLITADVAYEDFVAGHETFLRSLGELVFLEDFDLSNIVFFIFDDGTEGELWFGSESHLDHIHSGPYHVLLDKKSNLAGAVFPEQDATHAEQIETLRRQISWFWHELSHFTTAMGRGQLWWAHGQLHALRLHCMNLARLRENFSDTDVGSEGYFKIERALPVERLARLQATYCPLEQTAMLQAARIVVSFYQELALSMAQAHGIAYPADLERVMVERLEQVCAAHSNGPT
jgi:predicted nucleotidyltransferase